MADNDSLESGRSPLTGEEPRDWAHGIWQSLAMLLDAPIKKAFDEHLAAHQCTWAADGALAECQVAWDLFFLTADGRHAIMLGGAA